MIEPERLKELEALVERYAPTPLHEDLADHVQEEHFRSFKGMRTIHHPLVVMPLFSEAMHGEANRLYEYKRQRVAEARDLRDWHRFVMLHERPYRYDAFYEIQKLVPRSQWWRLFSYAWTDSENIRENAEGWRELWTIWRQAMIGRDSAMDTAILGLPEAATVYRGYAHPRAKLGLSWTLDQSKARWFARRYRQLDGGATGAWVAQAMCDRRSVLAYFQNRGEEEIVVFPEELTAIRQRKIG